MHALARALTALLVVLAVAAPTASARIDPPASQRTQDLRHLAAGGTSQTPPGPLWSYGYEAPTPAPAPVTHASGHASQSDDGTDIPWMTIGFIVAGTTLLVSASVVLTMRRRSPAAHAA